MADMAASRGSVQSSTAPSPELVATSLVESLDCDTRPTFVLDVAQRASVHSAAIVYRNTPFRDFEQSLEQDEARAHSTELRNATVAFFAWAGSDSIDLVNFRDALWSAFTIKGRWRVISGIISKGYQRPNTTPSSLGRELDTDYIERNPSTPLRTPSRRNSARCHFYPDRPIPHLDLIRGHRWHDTVLGLIDTWSPTLQHAVQFCLSNPAPSAVFTSPERIMVYNEAFCPLIGSWHPKLIGRSLKTEWDFWPHYENICLEVEATKQAVSVVAANGPLFERNGFLQETFFTFDYIPIFDQVGNVIAVCDQATDVTQDMFARGRMKMLQMTSDIATPATTLRNFWDTTLRILEDSDGDLPLASIFLVGDEVTLHSSTGQDENAENIETWTSKGSYGFPQVQTLTLDSWNRSDPQGFKSVMRSAIGNNLPTVLRSGDKHFPAEYLTHCGHKGHPYKTLILCPLRSASGMGVGCLVLGINPLRPYDDDYQHFIQVMARQIEDAHNLVIFIEAQAKLLRETMQEAATRQRILAEQLEQQTRKAQEAAVRFMSFANQAQVGVFVLDTDGSVRYCNDTWRHLMNLTKGEVNDPEHKHSWRPHIHPDDYMLVEEQWGLLIGGMPQESFEFRVMHPSAGPNDEGKTVYLRSSCVPEVDDGGIMKTITGILVDRSLEVIHEQATTARMEAALEEKRAQEYFMDMTSHEMRNPLNAMIQCAEEALEIIDQIRDAGQPSEALSVLVKDCITVTRTILYCGRHQKQLIDDVLTVSKLDANLLTICSVPTCPESVVRQAVKMFQMNMKAADVTWDTRVESTDILKTEQNTVLMDPGRVLQVLINLISNAVKFMKDQPERRLLVVLSASSDKLLCPNINYISSGRERAEPEVSTSWGQTEPVYIHFSIQDTGPGLTEQEMHALFARFQQASPRTHAQYGGSGLGLFISRELTELHGGAIGVASTVGKGSTFAFYIKARRLVGGDLALHESSHIRRKSLDPEPLHPQLTSSPPFAGPTSVPSKTKSASGAALPARPSYDLGVLIVEDNVVNQQVLERQLRKLGCRVTTANHGQEALDALQTSTWWKGPAISGDTDSYAFSVILCDLEMPVMDGKTCVKRIRQWQRDGSLHSDIPILAVTGNARVSPDVAREWGFDNVVSKPFSVKSLLPLFESLARDDDNESIAEGIGNVFLAPNDSN
ncbi:hypothetical protein BDZ85DRAFT_281255 [Elsinoe ampelina]|uniref:histidine kinase n=1 Tax=Elsinoe ampelina TaxID=302913 RepID=A0A6A6GCB5_9PEZI|nr:hypothetical protein BDZ85DRAFT_281255 [Elsinoe ampelina]